MIRKSLLVFSSLMLLVSMAISGDRISNFNRHEMAKINDMNVTSNPVNQRNIYIPLVLEGEEVGPDYWFGPEVNTQLNGFYDYQTNGECKHQINRFDATTLHAIFMNSTDSLNVSPSRRSVYAFSGDDGATWTFVSQVPNGIRSGFCSLESKNDGAALIGNHYQPGAFLTGAVHYDIAPGAGTFTAVTVPLGFNFIWPGVSRYQGTNNFLVAGSTYQGTAATDTGAVILYNGTTNTFSNATRLRSAATDHLNMRWTYAAGPSGKGIFVIDAISDVGGTAGGSRIFIFKTTNSGTSWDAGNTIIDTRIVGADTLTPFFGLDAIYDAAGNYYVAFNTTSPAGSFASGKLWVSKNGGTPVLVAQHSGSNGIPEAANLVLHADAGICTIDHPSLGVSSDGNTLYIGFTVQYEADTLNGYNKCHVYYSFSPTSSLAFNAPIKVTNSGPNSFDERYVSIIQKIPDLGGSQGQTAFMVYEKDPQPGSSAFNDGAPITRSTLISRKIYQANSPIGIKNIGSEIPKTYSLQQNFPNPFNPTTNIRFELPQASNVTIKVYDAVGKLIGTLVNNEMVSAGVKEINFNASGLASGVYYYTISAGSFNDTKKMVLVK
jgi:type IX secretion system substrate protein